jgi:hypothetical protein
MLVSGGGLAGVVSCWKAVDMVDGSFSAHEGMRIFVSLFYILFLPCVILVQESS